MTLSIEDIIENRNAISPYILKTPCLAFDSSTLHSLAPALEQLHLKLELFQKAGTFKPRGALSAMLQASPSELERGVTAVSAGNHAIAVSYAAAVLGTHATVVVPDNADPYRIERCTQLGAKVILMPSITKAFEEVERIRKEEKRLFVHPFEGTHVALGTGSLGLEILEQNPETEVVLVPVGGGGLIAGVATAIKLQRPGCTVIGVEPEGADSMCRSLESGMPENIEAVRTIADSLGAPYALEYSFSLCQKYVDAVVRVSDDDLRCAIALLMQEAKLAVEPAGAATTAALISKHCREQLAELVTGKKLTAIVCGSNISPGAYLEHLQHGIQILKEY